MGKVGAKPKRNPSSSSAFPVPTELQKVILKVKHYFHSYIFHLTCLKQSLEPLAMGVIGCGEKTQEKDGRKEG